MSSFVDHLKTAISQLEEHPDATRDPSQVSPDLKEKIALSPTISQLKTLTNELENGADQPRLSQLCASLNEMALIVVAHSAVRAHSEQMRPK